MCIFTHFAAGALAGGLTGNVYLGAAAGFASHAVLDVIPHYDHPDWRLELGGGVLSLILLLLMPFASWPAVIGGIFGMVPDLENLFQKLGKMRRDQFIYPTHTGLLPHGRTLGPKSIVWQFAIFACCYVLLGLFAPGQAAAATVDRQPVMAKPVVRVLETSADRTVLRVDFPVVSYPADWQAVDPNHVQWALPMYVDDSDRTPGTVATMMPPRMRLSLAVPTRRDVSWNTRDIQWWKEPRAGQLSGELVRFSVPVVSRSVPLTGSELAVAAEGGVLRGVTIEVNHPATGPQREHLQLATEVSGKAASLGAGWDHWRENTPSGVLNPALFQSLAMGSRQSALVAASTKAQIPDLFAMTDNWVKMNLTETGLYRLTGQELSNFGVNNTSVDPAKLRVFRGGGLPLDLDPEVPDSLQIDRAALNELAIEVIDGGDGEWNLDDEIRFYGVGTSTWLDRLDPAGERLEHFDHNYAAEAVYWLSWEDDLTDSPLPGVAKRVGQVAATTTGGIQESTARVRLHREEQFLDTAGVVQDNWVWDNTIFSSRTELFNLRTPVASTSARFQVDVRGVYTRASTVFFFEAAADLNNDQSNQANLTFGYLAQNDSMRVRLVGDSPSIVPGSNIITLRNLSTGSPLRPLALDSYDVLYWTGLELTAGLGQLEFAHWGDQVVAPGTGVDLLVTSPSTETPIMWEVTTPSLAEAWSGTAVSGDTFAYGVLRDPDTDRHFVAAMPSDLLSVIRGSRAFPISLRQNRTDWDYVVVHASAFTAQAGDLAAYHSSFLPGVDSPRALPISVDAIYDNFSGGQKDPRAIRNYLKWVYEQSAHRLKYVCLLGNASRDYRNYRDRTPLVDLYDLVSTEVRTSFPLYPTSISRQLAYAADDGLVSFDTPPPGDLDFPDLACGRLPALNVTEARGMVDRAIAYSDTPEPGLWRNNMLFTADDAVRPNSNFPNPTNGEIVHTFEAEDITNNYIPISFDLNKVYGVDYDFPPGSGVKPGCRADINAGVNAGTTVFYYVGHGAEDNLADEQIFQSRDIPNLTNGMKRPVFLAFSCDVGVFDSPSRRSMAEQFIQHESGGAIGAICASQVSYTFNNDPLTEAFFANLFPDRHVSAEMTISGALLAAKAEMTLGTTYRSNSQRYNLFGDPGMSLPHPVDDLSFAASSVDTLRPGSRQTAVLAGAGKALLGAGDRYSLLVEESASRPRFPFTPALRETVFVRPGSPVFIGSGTMGNSDLIVPFKVPVQLNYGDEARVRLLVESPDGDHIAVAKISAVRSATGPNDDLIGPAINLAFEDNRYRVRPGEELIAALTDTSGIAILGTSPGNSLLLELDDTGFMTDVTREFVYEPESYTNGRLVFPLPGDLANGRHKVALHASDALGNVGSDTLSFEIVPAGVTGINSVTLFPNPTPGYCRLIFELSDPMEVQWDIYTLAGSRLYSLRTDLRAGPQILEWDGLDDQNDEIANGTYLYVLRGNGASVEDREIRKTGKLVIMR